MSTQTILLDDNLINQIESFKEANNYETNSQAIAELIRTGLECLAEQREDEYLLALALEREKNGTGRTVSFEEHLAKRGLTLEALDNNEVYAIAADRIDKD